MTPSQKIATPESTLLENNKKNLSEDLLPWSKASSKEICENLLRRGNQPKAYRDLIYTIRNAEAPPCSNQELIDFIWMNKSEHEITREHIQHVSEIFEKYNELSSKLEKKEAEIKAKNELINELTNYLMRFLPHKTVFKTSSYFIALFSFSILSYLIFGVKIMEPFWATLGLFISGGFLVMSHCMFLDWKKKVVE